MNFKEIQDHYPAFIIHVPELAKDRTANDILQKVGAAGYKFPKIFYGVNGTDQTAVNNGMALFGIAEFYKDCCKANMGCNLAMLKLLKHIVDNNIPVATVFEDDIIFHPEWAKLAPEYYKHTPKNYDVIFMGNQVYDCFCPNPKVPRIHSKPCYCMHAMIVTLMGAKKMLSVALGWGYNIPATPINMVANGPHYVMDNCDVIINQLQHSIHNGFTARHIYKWYCWNGIPYQCANNKHPLIGRMIRNTGLVFQNHEIPTTAFLLDNKVFPNDVVPQSL